MSAFFEFLAVWFLLSLCISLPLGQWLGTFSDADETLDRTDEFSEGRNAVIK